MRLISVILSLILAIILYLVVWPFRPIWINFLSLSQMTPLDPLHLAVEFDPFATTGIFDNKTLPIPYDLSQEEIKPVPTDYVLGDQAVPKRIEVDLSNQRVYGYEGDQLVYNFLVSTGKWGRTPTGKFRIWTKLRYTKMSGGSRSLGTYYYLPNVPYVMFFANSNFPASAGFSLHGTYWHNNFGYVMSHGCINMRTEEAGQLYFWSMPDLKGLHSIRSTSDNPGTEVIIYGKPSWD